MSTLAFSRLSTPCFYRANGAFCEGGYLYEAQPSELLKGISCDGQTLIYCPVIVGTDRVQCPTCEGRGRILTPEGREMLVFLQTFMRKDIYEMIEEVLETKL